MSFNERAKSGKPMIGAYLALESGLSAHLMGRAGFDWVLIDMEHSPFSAREATNTVHAVAVGSRGNTASLIRVPSGGTEWVKWALDSGAAGVVVPMVQSRADAESLVKFARYPSVGERSFGPFQAPWADLAENSDIVKYVTKSAPAVAVIPMIESRAGVADAEGIMTTEGVTGIFVGPVDLRLSMGLTGADGEEPEYVEALEMILRIGKRVGIPVGIFAASPDALKKQIGMGFTYFLVTGDSAALSSGAQVAIETSRQVCRDLKL